MPAAARLHFPGALVHVISRIVNREFLIGNPQDRRAYLERIPLALQHTDWVPLAYAVMSNHVHLALVAGNHEPRSFFQGLHRSFAGWINQSHGRLGPVFAARPRTIYMPIERAAALVTYIHNNPVRAGVAATAGDSSWSSHRAWLDVEKAPVWLDVNRGMCEAGFVPTVEGRRRFDELVCTHACDERDGQLSGEPFVDDRHTTRAELALPVELSSPTIVGKDTAQYDIRYAGRLSLAPRWPGDLDELVERVSEFTGIPVAGIRSRSRIAGIVRARRLACLVDVFGLRRRGSEIGAALGISAASVSEHVRTATPDSLAIARTIEASIREGSASQAA